MKFTPGHDRGPALSRGNWECPEMSANVREIKNFLALTEVGILIPETRCPSRGEMSDEKRVLLLGRYEDVMNQITRLLEAVGFTVTSTVSEGMAIDMAGSSSFDALLIGEELPQQDRRYVTVEARRNDPGVAVIIVGSPESVLTQIKQAGIDF